MGLLSLRTRLRLQSDLRYAIGSIEYEVSLSLGLSSKQRVLAEAAEAGTRHQSLRPYTEVRDQLKSRSPFSSLSLDPESELPGGWNCAHLNDCEKGDAHEEPHNSANLPHQIRNGHLLVYLDDLQMEMESHVDSRHVGLKPERSCCPCRRRARPGPWSCHSVLAAMPLPVTGNATALPVPSNTSFTSLLHLRSFLIFWQPG